MTEQDGPDLVPVTVMVDRTIIERLKEKMASRPPLPPPTHNYAMLADGGPRPLFFCINDDSINEWIMTDPDKKGAVWIELYTAPAGDERLAVSVIPATVLPGSKVTP